MQCCEVGEVLQVILILGADSDALMGPGTCVFMSFEV